MSKRVMDKYYVPWLLWWPMKVFVIAAFAAYAIVSGIGTTKLQVGQPVAQVAPDDSYLQVSNAPTSMLHRAIRGQCTCMPLYVLYQHVAFRGGINSGLVMPASTSYSCTIWLRPDVLRGTSHVLVVCMYSYTCNLAHHPD